MDRDEKGYYQPNHTLGGRPREWTEEKLDGLAENLYAWVEQARKKGKFILLSDWFFEVGLFPQSLPRYIAVSLKFKEAHQWAKAWQEHIISKGALQKTLDSKFSQFFLAVNHGWSLDKERENREQKQKSNLEKVSDAIHSSEDEDEDS